MFKLETSNLVDSKGWAKKNSILIVPTKSTEEKCLLSLRKVLIDL